MIFKENNLYRIEVVDQRDAWYSFGKDLELIPESSLLKMKNPFKKEFIHPFWNDLDSCLFRLEPLKSNDNYSVHYKEHIVLPKEIVDLGIPENKDWIERNRKKVMDIYEQTKINYLKLSWWTRFKMSFGYQPKE